MSEPRRWLGIEEDHGHFIPIEEVKDWHRRYWTKAIEVMPVTEHEAVVAELKAEVEYLKRQLADAMSGCCDCPMFKAQGKTVAELKAENDILKSKASQFESTLKETMRVRDAEIERLKRYTQHRVDCISRVGVFEYTNDCDRGLEAIEKGKGLG